MLRLCLASAILLLGYLTFGITKDEDGLYDWVKFVELSDEQKESVKRKRAKVYKPPAGFFIQKTVTIPPPVEGREIGDLTEYSSNSDHIMVVADGGNSKDELVKYALTYPKRLTMYMQKYNVRDHYLGLLVNFQMACLVVSIETIGTSTVGAVRVASNT